MSNAELTGIVEAAYAERERLCRSYFQAENTRLAELCLLMARRFIRGGRLIAFGTGPAATDAQHVSVEFVHPVIVGKRALPALALPNDAASSVGLAVEDRVGFISQQLSTLALPEDIALGMVHGPNDFGGDAVRAALKQAQSLGMLSIFLGGPAAAADAADHVFAVPSDDPFVVQEIHETLYHVLWELVHVFFDHKGLLEDRPKGPAHDTGRSSFLYPWLAEAESEKEPVLREVSNSVLQKSEDVIAMRNASMDPEGLVETAQLIADRVKAGGKILIFGNGGSATDAQDFCVDLMAPSNSGARRRPVPAISLTNDAAVVSAVGNDVGFDNIFARQVIAYGNRGDVAVAISTSGGSRNVLAAVEEGRRRGLLTVALAGYGGGRLASMCDLVHVISADYIPRIQEAQASQYHLLCSLLGELLE
ncbi:MAG TPA: SIS domain-containing protein [Actinomycetota bacterium]|nr:SIS domain-containing protein [Actinomycetota bacterium]